MKQVKFLFGILAAIVLLAAGCNKAQAPVINEPAPSVQGQSQGIEIKYRGVEGTTALVLLKQKYQVETKEFSGLGEFVQSINGQQAGSDNFWAMYVNGALSQVGASQYITKSNDTIEWKLEKITPQ